MPLTFLTIAALEKLIVTDFFGGGPKAGHVSEIKTTDDIAKVEFRTWSAHRSYYQPRHVPRKLHWNATVQETWATSVEGREIACVDGHPILYARRLNTSRWETFEVVALQRGHGFDATAVRGFVLRLGAVVTFDPDRARAIKRLRRLVRDQALARLNGEVAA